MTDKPDVPQKPVYRDPDTAPFIYFDGAPTFGMMAGAIQIELASRVLVPGDTQTIVAFITTGRLRCSPAAARDLQRALTESLNMFEQSQQGVAAGTILN